MQETNTPRHPLDRCRFTEPNKLVPVTANVTGLGMDFTHTVPAYSITVLELTGR